MRKLCVSCIKSVGDTTRVKIYYLLTKKGEMSVGEIVKHLNVKQPTVSHHLKVLEKVGLLSSTKTGKSVVYAAQSNCNHYNTPCILQK